MKKKNWLLLLALVPLLAGIVFIVTSSSDSIIGAESEEKEQEAESLPSPEPPLPQEKDIQRGLEEEASDYPSVKETPDAETNNEEAFTVAFAGDTMFDWDLRPVLEEKGYDAPFAQVKKELIQADYAVLNLETVITERTEKAPGQLYWIKSEEAGLEALKNAGVDMVNLGNNHMLDYGEAGLLDTIDSAERHGMAYIGAGKNEQEAYQVKIAEINNQSVAFLSFTRFFPDSNWAASGEKPGVTNGYDLNFVINKIQEEQEKANADYLIVNFHWGVEKTNTPVAYQREYVQRIVEETETDAIIGAHPHWLQGFEFYQDVPIAYSLGNFLFPDYVSGHAAETGVYNLTFENGKVSAAFSPYLIKENQIQSLEGTEEQAMYQYLSDISINAQLDNNGNIIKK